MALDDEVQQVARGPRVDDLDPLAPVENCLVAEPLHPPVAIAPQELLERIAAKAHGADRAPRARVYEYWRVVAAERFGLVKRPHELARAAAPTPVAPHECFDHSPPLVR
jgi:hypothetical protein